MDRSGVVVVPLTYITTSNVKKMLLHTITKCLQVGFWPLSLAQSFGVEDAIKFLVWIVYFILGS